MLKYGDEVHNAVRYVCPAAWHVQFTCLPIVTGIIIAMLQAG